MKYLLFNRESNKFDDILKDNSVKKYVKTTIKYQNNLILGFPDKHDGKVMSYIMLKYGDDIKDFNSIVPDRSPVMYKDYTPKKK